MAQKISDAQYMQAKTFQMQAEDTLKKLKSTDPKRKQFIQQIANYQKTIDDYNAQKSADKTAKKDTGIKEEIDRLKTEREILVAKKKDTTDVDNEIKKLSGGLSKPEELPGIPPIPKDKSGNPVIQPGVDAKGNPITGPVTSDIKVSSKTNNTVITDKKVIADDSKTAYISALRETIKSLPKADNLEVTKLLDRAAKTGMQETAFIAELEKTKWWSSSLPTLQAYFLESHDPRKAGTFKQDLANNVDAITAKLESLGVQTTQVDPVTGKFYDNSKVIEGIASMSMMNGWNDNQLTQHLADTAQLHFTGGGTIGSTIDNIKLNATRYGINIDDNYLKQIQYSLLDPTDGRDSQYYLNEMKNQAMDTYKPFAEQIKSGRTLYEVTNNYRTKMANLLETDPSNVSWNDLMSKVIDPTTGVARMESEFTKQVKQDPLWQYTKNAKETYSNMALDLMQQFGFMG